MFPIDCIVCFWLLFGFLGILKMSSTPYHLLLIWMLYSNWHCDKNKWNGCFMRVNCKCYMCVSIYSKYIYIYEYVWQILWYVLAVYLWTWKNTFSVINRWKMTSKISTSILMGFQLHDQLFLKQCTPHTHIYLYDVIHSHSLKSPSFINLPLMRVCYSRWYIRLCGIFTYRG